MHAYRALSQPLRRRGLPGSGVCGCWGNGTEAASGCDMSFLRTTRPHGSYGRGRKMMKAGKKNLQGKQAWDNTVSDLTVHRATPEELIRRHELHKSKNQMLAQWELREKTLKKKWRKQRHGTPDPLEKRRLAIVKEILFDQYQLQDVLERSDRALAVVKDLFGDAPHRHPDSSQAPIVQKSDPATQLSILSESVMDRQALNEVERDESFINQLEDSEDEQDVSVNFQSNTNTNRVLHHLKQEEESASKLWAPERFKTPGRMQAVTPPLTPYTPAASHSLDQTALNATTAVRRTMSRLLTEDERSDESTVIGQVLNPLLRKQKQAGTKVKKKPSSYTPPHQKTDYSLSDTTFHFQNSNQSSLDVLNNMIKDVEHELEEYERHTGREVTSLQKGYGLTGFSLTLVSSLSRLVRYVKEGEIQLLQEMSKRQRLEVELSEHRALIDALTAEILSLKEENVATQKRLQQYIVATDEQLSSFIRVLELNKTFSATDSKAVLVRSTSTSQESATSNVKFCRPATFRKEDNEQLKVSQEDLPTKLHQWPSPSQAGKKGIDLPAHVFQPAVLLSPPRQKSHQEFSSEALKMTVPSRPTFQDLFPLEKEQGEHQNTASSPRSLNTQNSSEEKQLFNQKWKAAVLEEDLENLSQASSFLSLPRTQYTTQSDIHQLRNPVCAEGPKMVGEDAGKGDGQCSHAADETGLNENLVARIAQLTKQNIVIRSQLSKSRTRALEVVEGEQAIKTQNGPSETSLNGGSPGLDHKMQIASPPTIQTRLEERIAELNRQSAEARVKLLQMIEQQKQPTAASPPISPIPLQPVWTENEGKRTEVSIPQSEPVDRLMDDTPSPASKVSEKSFSRIAWGVNNKICSPLSITSESGRVIPVAQKAKTEKRREEGWFALSTHVK
ncbi:spindle and centriole-associated protein 1 isoform X2 [Rhinatrema bivittatum]|uniref:spindle and centriole-associated protein 1 isoform X2 n=1 Tax=Rhinatrema bivittatum TaxID=194408 RepID=UPI001129E6BD|nr:spindle and centriole-associated protein 1 isoform X2 [Rhinatrema bivittatum]